MIWRERAEVPVQSLLQGDREEKRADVRTMREKVYAALQRLHGLFFPLPPVCPVCLRRQERLEVCPQCRAEALRQRTLRGQCQRCHTFGVYGSSCRSCRQWPDYLEGNLAIWPYRDGWQQAILDFKFRGKPWLADALAAELLPVLPRTASLLVPVPLHANRLRERGYNQSALLAAALARRSGIPWAEALCRTRDTPHQTGLSRSERQKNLAGAFRPAEGVSVSGQDILLVDDVFTTGATLEQCAKVLHAHGASRVTGVTLASGEISS